MYKQKSNLYNIHKTKTFRSRLRRNTTKDERILWSRLKRDQLGVRFRRQFGIGMYIVDFFCPEKNIAIEVDGITHDSFLVQKRDKEKALFLSQCNIQLLRYTSEQVIKELDRVVEEIRFIVETTPSCPPS